MAGLGGCNLSSSQQQQISIARVILRKPSILLFDTSLSDIVEGEERSKTTRALNKLVKHQHVTVVHRSVNSAHNISWLKTNGYTILNLNSLNRAIREFTVKKAFCPDSKVKDLLIAARLDRSAQDCKEEHCPAKIPDKRDFN